MNALERSLLIKAGYDNGWEVVLEDGETAVVLSSALHGGRVSMMPADSRAWSVRFLAPELTLELSRSVHKAVNPETSFRAATERDLCDLLRQAAALAQSLPNAPEQRFEKQLEAALAGAPLGATEVERLIRQRVGQDIFRESLMTYWGGACAVTGVAIPELLRASHAKPWAECDSDAERLNVYNGFLLCAHLDALFDRFLLTFTCAGLCEFSPSLSDDILHRLGISRTLRLRWVAPAHLPFLEWHRRSYGAAETCRTNSQ
jgi:putative restriction endonuclease